MRKCRNWQTSKTKDLVVVTSCGFKSHLPQEKRNPKLFQERQFRVFLLHGKLRSRCIGNCVLCNKTLREDVHFAQRNMAAGAAALRRSVRLTHTFTAWEMTKRIGFCRLPSEKRGSGSGQQNRYTSVL